MAADLKTFNLYTFQVLPDGREIPMDLINKEFNDFDELIRRKGEIVKACMLDVATKLVHPRKQASVLVRQVHFTNEEITIIKLGIKKEMVNTDSNLNRQTIDNFPNILIVFYWPDQTVAIQKDPEVFQDTDTVAAIFTHNVNKALAKYGLKTFVKSRFEPRTFWSEVAKNEGRITWVRFDLVGPNMPRITSSIPEDIRRLQKETLATEAVIELNRSGAPLVLEPSNPDLQGLVKYSGNGGGGISFKAKGMRRIQQTGKTIKTVELSEVEIHNAPANIVSQLKDLLDS